MVAFRVAFSQTRQPLATSDMSFMVGGFMYKYLVLIGSVFSAAQPAWAQDYPGGTSPDDSGRSGIIVTATGLPQAIDRTGQSVTLISRDEIETIQGADISRILQRLPGAVLTRNGGLGGITLVGVRGAPAGQTLVLVDGARLNDPANANGEFDLSQLSTGTIESVELLRGPNSVVWGSQAMGGVINITTRLESGLAGSIEYGGDDQVTATAAAGHVGERLEAGLSGSFVDRQGYSAAIGGTEDDGYRQYNLAGRARYQLTDALALTGSARYVDGKVDLDGFPPPNYTFADADVTEDLQVWSGRVGAFYQAGILTLNAAFAISDTERDGHDPSFPYSLDGRSERAELFGRIDLGGDLALDFGADHEWTRFSNAPDKGKADISSGHAQIGYYGEALTLAAGLRYDDHSDFGSQWSFGANGAYEFAENWRVRAAYGEGFKAPTLYQLLSQYGNPQLDPEQSKGYEAGVSYGWRGDPLYFSASVYRRDSTNLIDFFSCFSGSDPLCATRPFGFYFNQEKARAQGFELEGGVQVMPGLYAGLVYSFADTENRTPGDPNEGNDFGRRPKHTATASLDWKSDFGLALGFDLRVVGKAWDNASNLTRLNSYALGDVRASFAVSENVELFGRVENVWDENYVIASGYRTQGRAAYIGARLRM